MGSKKIRRNQLDAKDADGKYGFTFPEVFSYCSFARITGKSSFWQVSDIKILG